MCSVMHCRMQRRALQREYSVTCAKLLFKVQIIFKVHIGTMHYLLLSLTLELERICLTSPECVSNLKVHLNDTYIYVKCNSPVRIFQMHHAAASIHAPPSVLCSYCDGISTMHIRSASPGCICVLQPTAVHHLFGRGNLSPGGQKQKPPPRDLQGDDDKDDDGGGVCRNVGVGRRYRQSTPVGSKPRCGEAGYVLVHPGIAVKQLDKMT